MCVSPSRALAHLQPLSGARARRSKVSLLACAAISVACVAQLARCLNSARPVPYAVPALMPAPMFFPQMMADHIPLSPPFLPHTRQSNDETCKGAVLTL